MSDTRECPYCAEQINRRAVICRYCNRDVVPKFVDNEVANRQILEIISEVKAGKTFGTISTKFNVNNDLVIEENGFKRWTPDFVEKTYLEFTSPQKSNDLSGGMVYCRGCGTKIHQTARSCPKCGASQNSVNSVNEVVSQAGQNGIVLLIVCIFLGVLGIHRFMVGKIGTGILMLLTFGAGGIWWIIDIIIIVAGGFTDKSGNRIKL